MRRIIGIDPGSRITGVGVIEHDNATGQSQCLYSGCIRLADKEMPLRLGTLFYEIQDIVSHYRPTELAIEQIFVHKSAASALKLGQARGVAIAAVMFAKLTVFEYTPRSVKQSIVGSGAADKKQVQHMIKTLLSLTASPQADAADALAVALCHAHMSSLPFSSLTLTKPSRRQKRWRALPL